MAELAGCYSRSLLITFLSACLTVDRMQFVGRLHKIISLSHLPGGAVSVHLSFAGADALLCLGIGDLIPTVTTSNGLRPGCDASAQPVGEGGVTLGARLLDQCITVSLGDD